MGTQQGGDCHLAFPGRSLPGGAASRSAAEWGRNTAKTGLSGRMSGRCKVPRYTSQIVTIERVFHRQAGFPTAYAPMTIALGRAPAARDGLNVLDELASKTRRVFVFCGWSGCCCSPRPTWPGRLADRQPLRDLGGYTTDRQQLPGRLQFFLDRSGEHPPMRWANSLLLLWWPGSPGDFVRWVQLGASGHLVGGCTALLG